MKTNVVLVAKRKRNWMEITKHCNVNHGSPYVNTCME